MWVKTIEIHLNKKKSFNCVFCQCIMWAAILLWHLISWLIGWCPISRQWPLSLDKSTVKNILLLKLSVRGCLLHSYFPSFFCFSFFSFSLQLLFQLLFFSLQLPSIFLLYFFIFSLLLFFIHLFLSFSFILSALHFLSGNLFFLLYFSVLQFYRFSFFDIFFLSNFL